MRPDYAQWLVAQGFDPPVAASRVAEAARVEACYGSLDGHHADGTLPALVGELTYSTDDERHGRPNPSKIPTRGNIRTNLASYKSAVALYGRFLSAVPEDLAPERAGGEPALAQSGAPPHRLSLEWDMQAALRRDIATLADLEIVDGGAERAVRPGLIDITCRDRQDGSLVVIELKAGKADSRAIGQILGYMADLAAEESGPVTGILVAHEFDRRVISAAKIIPALTLMRYAVEFRFQPVA